MSFQTALTNSLRRKDICSNRFLMQMKVTYSGGKIPQRTFVSNEEKRTLGSKTGRDRLTVLLCANAVGFIISTALIYKAAKPLTLKKNDKHQLLVFWLYNKKVLTMRTLLLNWFQRFLSLKSGNTLTVKYYLLKFF